MTPERWEQVRELLARALEVAPHERSALLERACSSDQALRQEIESLLASSDEVRSSFLDSPPLRATLPSGTRIGDYEVKSLLGSGGMGEVYRARDSRLNRDVAIKVLPALFSSHRDRLRRFEQEAQAAAALSHPNILAVFQMGTHEGAPYLVSEMLEGETLRDLLKRGRLPLRKAIDCAIQIAHGLGAAHEKGIVHRDLKPENLFVSKDGRVKILDFGLAKLTQTPEAEPRMPNRDGGTEPGAVMGTVGYMSPEQVRGQAADHRTDIFSFGAILYEMLTGKRAFQKPTSPETMTAILNEDPPGISQASAGIPPALVRVVDRCLEKNPEQRFQSAADLAFALDALSDKVRDSELNGGRSDRGRVTGTAHAGRAPRARHKEARTRIWRIGIPAALIVILVLGGLYYRSRQRRLRLTESDTIVLTDFANSTGDPIFDDTLKTALAVSLRQSPFLNVLSDQEVAKRLRQMARAENTKLTPEIALELCLRAGSKAYIAGAIGSLGSEYVLALKAVSCRSGDMLADEQVTATHKEKVLDALGKASAKLRTELGESLATVEKFNVPLSDATTSSLEALKAYSLGLKAGHESGPAASLPYDQRAIQLDPNFAMGYWSVGGDYSSLGEVGRAAEYYTKAFQLREHAGEQEKLRIAADYFSLVTGELDKAAETFQQEIDGYPRQSGGYAGLGLEYAAQGQYEKAVEITRQERRVAPDDVASYSNLGNYALALQHFDQTRQVIGEARAHNLDDVIMHNALYALAFLGGDAPAMAEQQRWFAGKPEFENAGLAFAADSEAYGGHLRKSRQLAKRALDSAVRADNRENGAIWQAIAAQREAAFGNAIEARRLAAEALKLAPLSQGAEAEAALAFAMAGDSVRAGSLARELSRRFPLDTQMQLLWLPAIQAQLAIGQNRPVPALTLLQAARPIELGMIPFGLNVSCLYPVYVRGEAYLTTGEGRAAAGEFQKILDHGGIVWNCWTGALARLGVARANAVESRRSQGADADAARVRALAAYQDFLTLWKEADPEIPILQQAKREHAKLQ